jgi:hypothetical protein
MRLALGQGIVPRRFAAAARVAARMLAATDPRPLATRLRAIWADEADTGQDQATVLHWIEEAADEDQPDKTSRTDGVGA